MNLSPTWYLADPDFKFWNQLEWQPLLFLHNLLEGLDRHITTLLQPAFNSPKEAEDVFERSTWNSCDRREITEIMHQLGHAMMLENYYHLRAIVADLDHREVVRLIADAARRAT